MGLKAFTLVYAEQTREHLTAIDRKHHLLIHQTIEEQLCYQPTVETRNRKPLRQPAPFKAEWEIRFGPDNRFRVLYAVKEPRVSILAIGVKDRSRLFFGGKEYAE